MRIWMYETYPVAVTKIQLCVVQDILEVHLVRLQILVWAIALILLHNLLVVH